MEYKIVDIVIIRKDLVDGKYIEWHWTKEMFEEEEEY